MLTSDNIRYLLTLPPQEIVNWYQSKGYRFSWNWQDTWQEAHARSFTVAKAMKLEILQSIKQKVDEIFTKGITFDKFKKDLEPVLKDLGWWGKVKASDVPGFDPASGIDPNKTVQLGSPRRLKTIYQVNSNVANNAGRWKFFIQNAASRPYLKYHQLDRKTKRKSHTPFHNRVFRFDDPIWDKIAPPSDWLCGCYLTAHTYDEVIANGWKISEGKDFISIAEKNIPEEWQYNPGKTSLWDINGGLPACPDNISLASPNDGNKKCIRNISVKTWKDYGRPDIRNLPPEFFQIAPPLLPEGKNIDEALSILKNAMGITENKKIIEVVTPIDRVFINADKLYHMVAKRNDRRERFGNFILKTLQNPFEIYNVEFEDSWRHQYIGLFTGKYNILSSVRINPDGSLFYNFMQAKDREMNTHRKGSLIWYLK